MNGSCGAHHACSYSDRRKACATRLGLSQATGRNRTTGEHSPRRYFHPTCGRPKPPTVRAIRKLQSPSRKGVLVAPCEIYRPGYTAKSVYEFWLSYTGSESSDALMLI
jgi:hypothetical protein